MCAPKTAVTFVTFVTLAPICTTPTGLFLEHCYVQSQAEFSPPLNAEIYTKHPILHTRCKIGCVSFKLLIISVYCGAGGNRTLVQTRKTQAFYMLIFDYIFVQRQNQSHQPMPYPLKLHLRREAGADYPRFGCTTWPECFGATASE